MPRSLVSHQHGNPAFAGCPQTGIRSFHVRASRTSSSRDRDRRGREPRFSAVIPARMCQYPHRDRSHRSARSATTALFTTESRRLPGMRLSDSASRVEVVHANLAGQHLPIAGHVRWCVAGAIPTTLSKPAWRACFLAVSFPDFRPQHPERAEGSEVPAAAPRQRAPRVVTQLWASSPRKKKESVLRF